MGGACFFSGILYAVGGYDGATRQCLSTVEAYNPKSNTWSYIAEMGTRRSGAGVCGWVCLCVYALSLIDWQTPRNDIRRSRCFVLLRCRCVKRFTVRRRGARWAAGEEELRSLRSDHQQLATGGGHEHVSAQRG